MMAIPNSDSTPPSTPRWSVAPTGVCSGGAHRRQTPHPSREINSLRSPWTGCATGCARGVRHLADWTHTPLRRSLETGRRGVLRSGPAAGQEGGPKGTKP